MTTALLLAVFIQLTPAERAELVAETVRSLDRHKPQETLVQVPVNWRYQPTDGQRYPVRTTWLSHPGPRTAANLVSH